MNIEKLQMCRLCLVEDVRMFNVTNKDLQTLYEKLTDVPFVSEDSRPMLACVFCYTKLKQCCQLQRKCLEAEKMLTEMLNEDHETKPQIKQGLIEFVIAPTETINIINECQSGSNDIKEELPDNCEKHNDINEIKEEHKTEFEYQDSCSNLEDMTTNYSESDSENDTPLMEIKIEEETNVSENKRRAEETQTFATWTQAAITVSDQPAHLPEDEIDLPATMPSSSRSAQTVEIIVPDAQHTTPIPEAPQIPTPLPATPRRRRRLLQTVPSPTRRRTRTQTQSELARQAFVNSDSQWRVFQQKCEEERLRLREKEIQQQERWLDLFAQCIVLGNRIADILDK